MSAVCQVYTCRTYPSLSWMAGQLVATPFQDRGTLTLPNRMLGGGVVEWYQDGQVLEGMVGEAAPDASRYDPANPGPIFDDVKQKSGRFALKAVTSDTAIKRAYEEATLFICKNTAAHGGGIGTNGGISMPNYGEPE